ncbi:MAG TPA: medium chain dehydrogenase/reductase family protein [Sandaracinaceae bacterium LLY-WYZ-13_1]|nr:medium chain dehydrogenase/reductase family protein [Sandaracinaceae bacterium LLY-WYZ-13_1]
MTTATLNAQMILNRFGGPEGFTLVEDAIPEPGPGQVRVRVLAASVQFTDVMIRKGDYPDLKQKPPFTPGYDVVGEIEAVGPGVDGLRVGQRVADLTMTGSYTRYRLLDAARVVPVPDGVDAAEAVTLVLSWMTAYQLLHRHARVERGQRVLVQGAAGAVGRPLLRLGELAGLEVFGTARAAHADLVASYGATPIDYRAEDFRQVLPDGVDVALDGIGQDGFARTWEVVRRGGVLSAYGFSHATRRDLPFWQIAYWYLRIPVWNLWPNGKRAGFYSITKMRAAHPDWFREDLTQLFRWLANGRIHPRVAERIQLADVPEAHRRVEAGGLDGKLIIVP